MKGGIKLSTIRVSRTTGETSFSLSMGPRVERTAPLPLANQLLSHFIDHFAKASRVSIVAPETAFPGSWQLDHVLCEDIGQLIGHGVAAFQSELASKAGVVGRARSKVGMDDAVAEVVVSFESRPRTDWIVPDGLSIDGFVDSWYDDDGNMVGWASGTNLRQFIDGFVLGSGATVVITVVQAQNLHHLYEVIFRALGEAVGESLGLTSLYPCLPGDTSGLAGAPNYEVKLVNDA